MCALMVKNESPVIIDTLAPLVKGGIDSYMVLDTGSIDDTIEKTENYFKEHGITNYIIEQEEFVDFEVSRNRCLELSDQYFPETKFVLMLDAEWIVKNVDQLISFCEQENNNSFSSYRLQLVQSSAVDFGVDRLIKPRAHCRFNGAVHEYLISSNPGKVPSSIYIEYNPTRYGCEKSAKRWERDVKILLKSFAKDSKDPRTAFYLAQTYSCVGDNDNAFRFYELRTQLPSWAEENYMAIYKLACCADALSKRKKNRSILITGRLAEWYFLKAYSMRPWRIEPLINLALHYLEAGNFAVAYLFALRAVETAYPASDVLFVEKWMYTYQRYDLLSRAAWYIGEYDKGEWALREGLAQWPNDQHFLNNLKIYLDRKEQSQREQQQAQVSTSKTEESGQQHFAAAA